MNTKVYYFCFRKKNFFRLKVYIPFVQCHEFEIKESYTWQREVYQ